MTIDARPHTTSRFLAQMADELRIPAATVLARRERIEAEIDLRGTYTQTRRELIQGGERRGATTPGAWAWSIGAPWSYGTAAPQSYKSSLSSSANICAG
jgi:hypothetical protein